MEQKIRDDDEVQFRSALSDGCHASWFMRSFSIRLKLLYRDSVNTQRERLFSASEAVITAVLLETASVLFLSSVHQVVPRHEQLFFASEAPCFLDIDGVSSL